MLGFGYWQTAFGGSREVIGRQMRIGGRSYAIVGVAAQDFQGSLRGLTPAFYAPASMVEELIGEPMFDEPSQPLAVRQSAVARRRAVAAGGSRR